MLLSFWDEFIYTALGFGIRGLGFVATEGYGDLFCNASVDVHFGEQIIVNQREAGCLSDGSKGDRYCTLCGYLYRNSIIQSSPRKHLYDNDCDVECNDCGHIRIVPHLYSYACDVHCDICGAVRAKPLSAHTFDANRICTKCGLEGHLIGDISGDGKVNMGDVSRAYAHTTGKTLLTDPKALAAADTNGDGKINLGDTSRILSHVRGTKLLW
jgi:ribosomal protein S27E